MLPSSTQYLHTQMIAQEMDKRFGSYQIKYEYDDKFYLGPRERQ